MDNVAVLIAGLPGGALAVSLVVRWHDPRRAAPSPAPDGTGASSDWVAVLGGLGARRRRRDLRVTVGCRR